MRKSIASLIFLVFACTACGIKSLPPIVDGGQVNEEQKRQQEIIIKDYTTRIDRVARVSHRLMAANVDLCGDMVSHSLGLTVMAKGDVFRPYREAAAYFLKMDDNIRVLTVAQGGPADQAGVQVGDVVLQVNGQKCTDADQVPKAGKDGQTVALVLERAGAQVQASVAPARVCSSPVRILESPEVNALAFGEQILIMTGMVKLCQTDDELAVIIGHELAHNSMKHIRAKQTNSLLMSLLIDAPIILLTGANPQIGANIGAGINSQDFESEADYIGLYHVARAGYDIENAAGIWRRMAVESPSSVSHASSHPTTATRFVALEAARDEIKRKREQGLPLKPEMQPDS